MSAKGKLFLIPVPIAEGALDTISPQAREVALHTRLFIVERARTARRYLKSLDPAVDIDSLTLVETSASEAEQFSLLERTRQGENVGILSEAGCPAVADPGMNLVAEAHRHGIDVVPLVGPSSILLALMASGFSGQGFCFHGYLPVQHHGLRQKLKALETEVQQSGATQLFMETPYRSVRMYRALVKILQAGTSLSIASNLTGQQAFVRTETVSGWLKVDVPPIDKVPTIFSIGLPG